MFSGDVRVYVNRGCLPKRDLNSVDGCQGRKDDREYCYLNCVDKDKGS